MRVVLVLWFGGSRVAADRGGFVVGSEDHAVPLRHPAYLSSLLSCIATKLDLANYQLQ